MKYLSQILIIVLLFSFTSCKNSIASDSPEYLDVDFILIAKTTTYEELYQGEITTFRNVEGYYLSGPINRNLCTPNSFYEDGVDRLKIALRNCNWIRYYQDDSYIKFEKYSDGLSERFDVSGHLVYYAITN